MVRAMVFCDRCTRSCEKIDPNDPDMQDLVQELGEDFVKDLCDELNEIADRMRKIYRVVRICKLLTIVRVCNPESPAQCVDVSKICEHFEERK